MTRIKIIVWYRFSIAVKLFRSTCSFRSSTTTTMVVLRTNWAWPFLLRTHRRFPTASLQTPSMALRSWSIWAASDWAWAASVLRFPPVKIRTNNDIFLFRSPSPCGVRRMCDIVFCHTNNLSRIDGQPSVRRLNESYKIIYCSTLLHVSYACNGAV